MSNYENAVFFKAKNLTDEEMKKIRKYFQIRRQSGGGDCGEVEKLGDDAYKIAFLEKTAQERILHKTDHIIFLPGRGNLHILPSCCDIREDKNELLPHSSVAQKTTSSGKPVEEVFHLEPYLLRYLEDSKSARSHLEKNLLLLSSTFKLDLDSEKVVVMKNTAQTGEDHDDIAQQKWTAKVEKVLLELQQNYIIRFVIEPEKIKFLLQENSLFTKYVTIYKEDSFVVIVGENKEVEKFMNYLDTSQSQACKEFLISESQHTLVKGQFESNLSGIEIIQDRPGSIILKGPEKQVQAGGTKLQELLNHIQEKRMQLHHVLIAFLVSSGTVQKLQTRFQQNLCSPVLLEATGSDLVLLSLSPGALQEAATAVERDLCAETVPLESTESPGLETLKKSLDRAIQQANQGCPQVKVSYESGTNSDSRTKVLLVGYRTEVSKLKEIVQDYKQNHVEFNDYLQLPLPELVYKFSDLLRLVDVKSTTVRLRAVCSPGPCVHLSGPRCRVNEMKKVLDSALRKIIWKVITVDGPGALQFFQEEGSQTLAALQSSLEVIILPKSYAQSPSPAARNSPQSGVPNISTAVGGPQQMPAGPSLALEIVFGRIEDQQVDVLVAPMLKTSLTSTAVGQCMLNKAGEQLKNSFNAARGKRTLTPGDVLQVDGAPLGCSRVFFIECVPWSGATNISERALGCGLERVLALCEQHNWGSVAMPVIGPGLALSIPVNVACNILTVGIGTFGRAGSTGSLSTIRVVIMPQNSDSEKKFHEVCTGLSAQMVDHAGQAVFQSLSSETDEVTITLGRCHLHVVFGDISNESTDVIVNTTDFRDLQTDVCNDILTVAGPQVQADLAGAQVGKGEIFTTQPGHFPCKVIMHVCGDKDAGLIRQLVKDIVSKCEHDGYQSVAIPAICAGKGGLDARVVAQSILQGVKDATVGADLKHLNTIRIVLMKIHVFLEFKVAAQQIFATLTQMTAPAPRLPLTTATRGHQQPRSSIDVSALVQSLPAQQTSAAFLIVGLTAEKISDACVGLHQSYKGQCSSQSFSTDELKHLTAAEMDRITNYAPSLGIEIRQCGPDDLTVSGLTKGVNEIIRLIQGALVRQVREKEQDSIFSCVSWCILGLRGDWERLPKEAHHQLEKQNFGGEVTDAQGRRYRVDLIKMEATLVMSKQVTRLKRLENLSDFCLPLYWDSMDPAETVKLISLQPSSAEYKRVKQGFKNTVQKAVLKIDRVQNVRLRQAYEVRKKQLQDKNGPLVGAGEKILYHGTTDAACSSIQNTNFNRNFAGQNATKYGVGTYFAVDASYSANTTYSVPTADGTQLMFVALVLTGCYTQGHSGMKSPPPRSPRDPNDCFDSVVDNMQRPNMFVVFHDCQAYPDYLITFK